ncbi:MAG: nitrate reductase cytochrome c-type subunit [Rhodospirillales bacterium]|nr:MAG: nitrate reductase cytochrome c-type subunit [Rhodospirillales bacterium]
MRYSDKGGAIVNKILDRFARFVVLGAFAIVTTAGAVALSVYLQDQAAAQPAGEVRSLRGETEIPDNNMVPAPERQETRAGSFDRAYRQQPPLIPHKIQSYQITRTVNQCIQCHDWPFNVDQGAPKISETHYFNRDGVALDRVSSSRWFCTQCHVPQSNARDLVNNEFKPAIDVE